MPQIAISSKQKFLLTTLLLVVVGLALGLLMLSLQSLWFAFALIVWTFASSYLLYQVRCPNCGTSLSYKGKVGGMSLYAGFANRRCQNCGHDLTVVRNK
jgi:hypothetical protein